MNKFTTNIKTGYKNVAAQPNKKEFTSKYSVKNGRTLITGDNRSMGKRYDSQLIR